MAARTGVLQLVALFGPEHGLRGTAEAGEKVASGRDHETDLPIYSLYGETLQIRFVATDRNAYDPALAGIASLVEIRAVHGETLTFRESHFDRLAGRAAVREAVLRGASVEEITQRWSEQRRAFEEGRMASMLY